MRIAAIDTADRDRVTVALVDGDSDSGRTVRGEPIDRVLVPMLVALGLHRLDAVVVVVGPGSYTGVRAGMAAAAGLARAAGLPLHGAGALEVVAHGAPPDAVRVGAVAGAGRGGLYVAGFARDGNTLAAVGPVRRVETAAWRPEPGLAWVALDRVPEGVAAGTVRVADAVAALAAAARSAELRTPLDAAGLRADVGIGGRR